MGIHATLTVRRMATALTATGCALCLGTGAALADHTPYPPEDPEVVVVTPAARIDIRGDDWSPRTVVEIRPRNGFGRADAAAEAPVTATVDDDGTFEVPVEIPEDVPAGEVQYDIVGTGADGNERHEVEIFTVETVAAPAIGGTPFEPAPEDDQAAGWIVAGAAAAVAGGGLALRRRRRTEV